MSVQVVALVGVAGVVAGTLGAVTSVAGLVVAAAVHRRVADGGAWLVVPLVVTYAAYAALPWGGSSVWAGQLVWPQVLLLLSLSAVAGWAWLDEAPRRRPRRSAGSSTTR